MEPTDKYKQYPEITQAWLKITMAKNEELAKLRQENRKTSTKTLQEMNKPINERLWEMKENNHFIDSIIIAAHGSEEGLHLDVMNNLDTPLANYLVALDDQDQDECPKKYALKGSISSDLFHLIVYFAYHRKCNLNKETAFSLGLEATKLNMTPVVDYCIAYMLDQCRLGPQSDCDHAAVNGLYLASFNLAKFASAKEVFKTHIENNFETIHEKPEILCKLSFELVCEILKSTELNITSETIIWNVIERWVEHDLAERFLMLIPLMIEVLRLGRLDKTFITETIVKSKVFECQPLDAHNEFVAFIDKLFKPNGSDWIVKDGHGLLYSKSCAFYRPRATRSILLAFGGWIEGKTTPTIEIYDYQINLWQTSSTKLPKNLSYFALEIIDHVVYVFGGSDSRQIFKNLRALNLRQENVNWVEKCSMIEFRCYLTSVACNGQLYAIGGFNRTSRTRKCERYEPKANRWTEIAELNHARSDAAATVLNGKIYVAGGINDSCIEKTVEVYDPVDNHWIMIKAMHSPRTSFALVAFANLVWALGGNTGEERTKTVECYEPSSDTWSERESMIDRRSTFKALAFNKCLYVVGGYNGESPISGVEKYVPEKGWSRVKQLKHDRSVSICSHSTTHIHCSRFEETLLVMILKTR